MQVPEAKSMQETFSRYAIDSAAVAAGWRKIYLRVILDVASPTDPKLEAI